MGQPCPCGQWVVPAFHLANSKVDKCVVAEKGAGEEEEAAATAATAATAAAAAAAEEDEQSEAAPGEVGFKGEGNIAAAGTASTVTKSQAREDEDEDEDDGRNGRNDGKGLLANGVEEPLRNSSRIQAWIDACPQVTSLESSSGHESMVGTGDIDGVVCRETIKLT